MYREPNTFSIHIEGMVCNNLTACLLHTAYLVVYFFKIEEPAKETMATFSPLQIYQLINL